MESLMVLWTGAESAGRKMDDTPLVGDPDPARLIPRTAVRRSSSLTAAPAAYSRIAYSSRPAAGGEDVRNNDFGLCPIRALQHQEVLKMPLPEAAMGTDQIRRLACGLAKVIAAALAILIGLWIGFAISYAIW